MGWVGVVGRVGGLEAVRGDSVRSGGFRCFWDFSGKLALTGFLGFWYFLAG